MPPLTSIDLLGLVAGAMTTVSFVPQAVKTLRTRRTRDISLSMWLMFCCGVGVWIVYGLLVPAWPVVAANIPTLILAGAILAVKIGNLKRE